MNYDTMYYILAFIYFNPWKTDEEIYNLYDNALKQYWERAMHFNWFVFYINLLMYKYKFIRFWKWRCLKLYAYKQKTIKILNENWYEIDDWFEWKSDFWKAYDRYKKKWWWL